MELFADPRDFPVDIFYFSSSSETVHTYVHKMGTTGITATRIPISRSLATPVATRPYLLFTPTYGAGTSDEEKRNAIKPQVLEFLSLRDNRRFLRGVIGNGNTNYGANFVRAAWLISQRAGVPMVHSTEMFGALGEAEALPAYLAGYRRRLEAVGRWEQLAPKGLIDVAQRAASVGVLGSLHGIETAHHHDEITAVFDPNLASSRHG